MRLTPGMTVQVQGTHTAVGDNLTTVTDAEGRVLYAEPAYVTVGVPEGVITLEGRDVAYAVPLRTLGKPQQPLYRVAVYLWPDGEPSCWLTHDCATGDDPWLLTSATPMRADDARRWIDDWLNTE